MKPRTISITDLAWVVVAAEDVAEHRGILNEERVNRMRYLDGTPKGSTRWIDTGWAIAAWHATRSLVRDPVALDARSRRVHVDGKPIDASFRVERVGDARTIVFDSRGGTKGSKAERNVEYAKGLEILLDRLRIAGLQITNIVVESKNTSDVDSTNRRVNVDSPYPITVGDVALLRRQISGAQAAIGRKPGAKGGGNQTKRLRLFLDGDAHQSLATLGQFLERGS